MPLWKEGTARHGRLAVGMDVRDQAVIRAELEVPRRQPQETDSPGRCARRAAVPRAGSPVERAAQSRDGTEIAYRRSGEGRPLVLVHGTTSAHSTWRPLLPTWSRTPRFTPWTGEAGAPAATGPSTTWDWSSRMSPLLSTRSRKLPDPRCGPHRTVARLEGSAQRG